MNNTNASQYPIHVNKLARALNQYVLNERFTEYSCSFTHYVSNINTGNENFYFEGAMDFIHRVASHLFPGQDLTANDADSVLELYLEEYKEKFPFTADADHQFTFIDLFAGIGGFRIALQEQGGKSVFSSEWDRWSKRTYYKNYGEVPFGDITKIEEDSVPDHDLLVGGFPCQPFSLAGVSKKNSLGRQHGFLDETQGTLFFDIARILESKRPGAFILENVKNLKSHDKGNTLRVIEETLANPEGLNYEIFHAVLDAKYYVPQHRERIFIVGFDRTRYNTDVPFEFPTNEGDLVPIGPVLHETVDPKYTLSDKLWEYLQAYARKHRERGNGFGFGLVDFNGVARTLSARYHKDGAEILIPQGKKMNPRRLTPDECRAIMGFPEDFLIKDTGVSDTQLYRQFGNSVAVPVVTAVAESVIQYMNENELEGIDENDILHEPQEAYVTVTSDANSENAQ